MKYQNLNRLILEEDRELRIFLSGGRVRVINDRKDHGDNFYGEGAQLDECLEQAEKNCELKLTYDQGYQDEGHPFNGYLTGGYPATPIDNGLFNYGTIHIRRINNQVYLIHEQSNFHPSPIISGVTLDDAIENYNKIVDITKPIPYYSQLK